MAYRRIVLGSDGSDFAHGAEHAAASIARACAAELLIVHAAGRAGESATALDRAVLTAAAQGIEASTESRVGAPAHVIVEVADQHDADLIVLGSRGLTLGQQIIGSVAHAVSRHAPCDVLLVGERTVAILQERGWIYTHILVATDGSPTADRAARKGLGLAETVGAPATLVFVGHPKTGELVLRDTVALQGNEGDVSIRILEGDPAERIMEVARREGHDLIVVGNKGMTGAKSLLLGSVPKKISEYAPCDVLIARTVTRALSELKKGEGGLVTSGDRKIAAYRDGRGEVHGMSARCTHMGCTVGWNAAEKTWDCPCHGSRFAPTGEVVHGPAKRSLEPTDL